MKPLAPPPALETAVRCQIGAAAFLRWDASALAGARRTPIEFGAEKLPVSFLKHADDQTLLAVCCIREALDRHGWRERNFADWGVIAAPNLFARIPISAAIHRIAQEGAWGVSPQLIPHFSLHAISGTISQALRLHGPNLGVGGGAGNAGPDAILMAATLLADGSVPGVWLILSGHESEWIPDADGSVPTAPLCQAVALALTPCDAHARGPRLALGHLTAEAEGGAALAHLPEFHLDLLAEEWLATGGVPSARWRLGDDFWLEMDAEDRL